MAGGLAAGLALGGAGISFAASSGSSSSSTTAPPNTPVKPGHVPRGLGLGLPGFGRFGGLGRVVHGEATVSTGTGGYQTIAFQVGSVTAVSSTSISVKSADGYTIPQPNGYAVTATTIVNAQRDGISTVKTGDQVWVIATKSTSGQYTATNITDVSQLKNSWAGFGFGPGPGASRDHEPGASTPAAA
jgi:hypothetical protein